MTCADLHPVAFVVSLNLHRRHLSESQRGMVAAKLETLSHGQRADRHANLHVSQPVTRESAAQLLNVSTRTVAAAARVKDEGAPELVAAARESLSREIPKIATDVRKGTRDDALVHSVGCNEEHGLPRTNADKRNAVRLLLSLESYAKAPDREIARICKVTHPFVAKARAELSGNDFQIDPKPAREVIRNGKSYEMDTANIGKRQAAPR